MKYVIIFIILFVFSAAAQQENPGTMNTNTNAGTILPETNTAVEPQDQFQKGIQFYNRENYEEAASCFVLKVSEDRDSFYAYYYLGLTYRKLKKYDNALLTFQRALELKRTDPKLVSEIYLSMIQINVDKKDLQNAITVSLSALEQGYKTPGILNKLAAIYLQKKNYTKSRYALDLSLEIDPVNPYTYNLLSSYYISIENYSRAVTAAETAAAFGGNTSYIFNNMGYAYEKLGKYEKAKQAYSAALELYPGSTIAAKGLKRVEEIIEKRKEEDR